MKIEEPKVEFVPVETDDVIATSNNPSGPEIHICGGESFDDECPRAGSL